MTPLQASNRRQPVESTPFLGLIDAVMVPDPAEFAFDGAISYAHARAAWVWMTRDLAPDLLGHLARAGNEAAEQLAELIPQLLQRARAALGDAAADVELERRLVVQLGGPEPRNRLLAVLQALKSRLLLEKAQSFGRAANAMTDETALSLALQSMPVTDPHLSAMIMQAAVGQIANPGKLVMAVIRISGGATEQALTRAGFAPMIDAILAHAQAQIPYLTQEGTFADIDFICRSIDRFHRLMRSVTGYMEIGRFSRWSAVTSGLTTAASGQIESRLRHVVTNVNLALRRHSGPNDRLDSDLVLEALNSCYLLATVRDCRDSLAVNTVFEQTWSQVGQSLEVHLQRNLDLFRSNPMDRVAGARLDAAIKMAELRFNGEYAETIRKARDIAERRVS